LNSINWSTYGGGAESVYTVGTLVDGYYDERRINLKGYRVSFYESGQVRVFEDKRVLIRFDLDGSMTRLQCEFNSLWIKNSTNETQSSLENNPFLSPEEVERITEQIKNAQVTHSKIQTR
jgi:hypothetical protein